MFILSFSVRIQFVINLAIDSFVVQNIDTTICQGQTLSVNGVTYTDAGFYQDTAVYAASGCDSIQFVINPYDEFALTRALQLKEAQGGSVTVLNVGPASTEPTIISFELLCVE